MSKHNALHPFPGLLPSPVFPSSKWLLTVVGTVTGFVGCSAVPTGEVVMKIDERTAHISAEPGTLKRGDIVALVESRCPRGPVPNTTRKPSSDNCKKTVRGTGTIAEMLNEEYAVAEFPDRVGFEEGDAVEPYDRVREWERDK